MFVAAGRAKRALHPGPAADLDTLPLWSWQPEELGEHYLVQQQIGGWPLSVFKFPERVHFAAQSTMKIWTSCSDPGLYKPPTDFVFRQLVRWSVGASICTLLCQPNGKVKSFI